MPESFTALLDAIHLLHEQDERPFHERLFDATRLLFPDTVHTFQLWRKTDGHHEAALNIDFGSQAEEIMEQAGRLIPLQHPCYEYVSGDGLRPMRLQDFASHREFRKTDLYQITFRPIDVRHQMSIPLITESHIGALVINRLGSRSFTDQDVHLAAQFGRFVDQAYQTSVVLVKALLQRPAVEARDHTLLRRAGLSRREAEVLHWMAQGKRDKEISIILGISYRTVTHHVSAILQKLRVETRTAAVALAIPPDMQALQAGQKAGKTGNWR
jgi:DNA-binding CsgD family transcriptional regulator